MDPPEMTPRAIAVLIESSEADAYASLAACGAPTLQGHRIGGALALVAPQVNQSLIFNRVVGLGIGQPAKAEDLDEIATLYRGRSLSFGVELGPPAEPADLLTWLKKHRLRRTVATAMRWRSTSGVLPPSDPRVVLALTPQDRAEVARLCCDAFNMPAAVASLLAEAGADPRWRHWMCRQDGQVVAAALSYADGYKAWLGWDATHESARAQGLHAALIGARVRAAAEQGCRYLTTETAADTPARSDPSGRNYQRLGFEVAYVRLTYVALRTSAGPRGAER